MKKAIINVHGMSCEHCERAVKNALTDLAGVASVSVDLKGKTVTVEYDENIVLIEAVKKEITETGYTVVG